MLIEERRQSILDWTNQQKFIPASEISRRLNISIMTVWRDLKFLEKEGLIQRVRGGAASILSAKNDAILSNEKISFDISSEIFSETKSKIGRYVAENLVSPADNITLEGGTTVCSMIPYLACPNLTLLTNGIHALLLASRVNPAITVLCCGGIFDRLTRTFVGPQSEKFFTRFRVNKVFLGAQGITLEDEFTDPSPFYVSMKQVMRAHADKTIMMIDSSKFNRRTLTKVLRFDEVDILVRFKCSSRND